MTTEELIDALIAFTDDTDGADADSGDRRDRLRQYAQEVYEFVWYHRQWRFRLTTGTTTISAAANYGLLPTDFDSLGDNCGVWDASGHRWSEVTPQVLEQERLSNTQGSYIFSFFGIDITTGKKKIQTLLQGAATTLTVLYLQNAPVLVDDDAVATNNLGYIPVAYHNTVLMPGAVAKVRASLGDARNFEGAFKEGLAHMVENERPRKSEVRRIPMSRGGMC